MKVILLKSVPKVGAKDTIVEVAGGYAENALLPRKLAVIANEANVAALNRRKQNAVAQRDIQHTLLDNAIKAANALALTIPVRANAEGVLFSKFHEKDITEYLAREHRISIDTKNLSIADGAIKHTGTHHVTVVDGDYKATLTVSIISAK